MRIQLGLMIDDAELSPLDLPLLPRIKVNTKQATTSDFVISLWPLRRIERIELLRSVPAPLAIILNTGKERNSRSSWERQEILA